MVWFGWLVISVVVHVSCFVFEVFVFAGYSFWFVSVYFGGLLVRFWPCCLCFYVCFDTLIAVCTCGYFLLRDGCWRLN